MTSPHQAMPGTQLGDPARAAAAIIAVVEAGAALARTTDVVDA